MNYLNFYAFTANNILLQISNDYKYIGLVLFAFFGAFMAFGAIILLKYLKKKKKK